MKTESFVSIFSPEGIQRIEIPIIQRDYAQGRRDAVASRIRESFLDVLTRALTGGEPVSLDFVYGDIAGGVLTPLDGQQRLTTLFLLHWYVVARAGVRGGESEVLRAFTYATRHSSREFCRRLADARPPFPVASLSGWIRDQSWFFGAWRHDPTIQSMLVILDDIHRLLCDADCTQAWARLVDRTNPAIVFHVLPLKDLGLTDDLYIKMNSRGKPLTPFEHFKARFEKTLRETSPEHYREFSHKVDNAWADLLWDLRGDGDVIDDEFMRYFRFVTDALAFWRGAAGSGPVPAKDIDAGATSVYGSGCASWKENQRFLFDALDCWPEREIPALFQGLFTEAEWKVGAVAIYDTVDLFEACCRHYGAMEGRARKFSLPRTLLLFGVVIHRVYRTAESARRIRTLRNLVFGSDNEVRLENFPELLADVEKVITTGDVDGVGGFNSRQAQEEKRKAEFLSRHPELEETLFRLEDHDLLRGTVAAFDLDAATLPRRATAFHEIFPADDSVSLLEISGALLACGDYSQRRTINRFQLGSWRRRDVWRQLFTNTANSDFRQTSAALMRLLDAISQAGAGPIQARLRTVVSGYLDEQARSGRFDWRYYLVKYDQARQGDSGIYVGPEDGTRGFELCMMYKERMSSWYRDPYLFAIHEHLKAPAKQAVWDPWHTGYWADRWLTFDKSRAGVRCGPEGFVLSPPEDVAYGAAFADVLKKHGVDPTLTLRVRQVQGKEGPVDAEDRVQKGVALVEDLAKMEGG